MSGESSLGEPEESFTFMTPEAAADAVKEEQMNFRASFGEEIIGKVGSCVILGRRPILDMVTE